MHLLLVRGLRANVVHVVIVTTVMFTVGMVAFPRSGPTAAFNGAIWVTHAPGHGTSPGLVIGR